MQNAIRLPGWKLSSQTQFPSTRNRVGWLLVWGNLPFVLFLWSCGKNVPDAGPRATGVVTLDGRPITSGTVFFSPKQNGSSAFGVLGADGRFEAYTSMSQKGLAAGEYRVYFATGEAEEDSSGGDPPSRLPRKFTDLAKSGLEVTVSSDGPNEFEFHLKSTDT